MSQSSHAEHCDRCGADGPDLAQFCWRCGQSLRPQGDRRRRRSYAIQPSEHVVQLALTSTLLPHSNRSVANEYAWALAVGAAAAVVLAVTGVVGAAVVVGAFLMPVTYLVYAHDVDLWEERPGATLGALYLASGVGAALVTLALFGWADDAFAGLLFASGGGGGLGASSVTAIALFSVVLAVVSELVRQIGPVVLARQPRFDDMIDGFAFGVASGVVYAAFETVVAFGAVFTTGLHSGDAAPTWVVVVLNIMLVKPIVYGLATGTAVATFSGKGEGYDGFTGRYVGNLALAMVAVAAYWLGVRLLAPAPFGQALGLVWGGVVAALLMVRSRVALQEAVIEAAVEDAAREARPKWATTDLGTCPECENTLLPDALFCIVCGASVRATSAGARRQIREPNPSEERS